MQINSCIQDTLNSGDEVFVPLHLMNLEVLGLLLE